LKSGAASAQPGGPPLYPEPERSFRGYPSAWLDSADRLESDAGAVGRLDTFLATPLTHHAGKRRARDPSILANVLGTAANGCSIAEVDAVFRRAGVDHRTARATLAWLLKYGLLAGAAGTITRLPERSDAEPAPGHPLDAARFDLPGVSPRL